MCVCACIYIYIYICPGNKNVISHADIFIQALFGEERQGLNEVVATPTEERANYTQLLAGQGDQAVRDYVKVSTQ